MNKHLISVIIPVFNKAAYLPGCLASVFEQTFSNIEILLIEDGSTDGSLAVCRRLQTLDSRIRLIENPKNLGAAMSRNIGLDAALGDLIAFVDADDRIDPAMLQTMARALEEIDADVAVCGFCYQTVNGTRLASFSNPDSLRMVENQECLRELVRLYPVCQRFDISLCNKLYRKEAIGGIRLEDLCSEDYLFNCHVFLSVKRVVHIPQVLYFAIQTANSFSRAALNAKNITALEANRRALEFLTAKRPDLIPLGLERLITLAGQLSVSAYSGCALPYRAARKMILAYAREAKLMARRYPGTEAARAVRRQAVNIYTPFLNRPVNTLYSKLKKQFAK